ncbi:hypothetical protein GCM10009765_31660 [Fodinicola feengrottensis]|uniref:Uncharacterized protein n=1 Tax=Fodinicola feengrottensis TaxID=435914 RepID=A0ABN2H115_9ACTN
MEPGTQSDLVTTEHAVILPDATGRTNLILGVLLRGKLRAYVSGTVAWGR